MPSSSRGLLSAAAVCMALAACGGTTVQVTDNTGGLPELETRDEAWGGGQSPSGTNASTASGGNTADPVDRTLEARQREVDGEKRIYIYKAGSDTPLLWATVHDKGGLMFAYLGKRYTVDYGSLKPSYAPGGEGGVLIAGGEMPAGARVGIGKELLGGDASPLMVTVAAASASKGSADFVLARCDAAACADTPSGGDTHTVPLEKVRAVGSVALGVSRLSDDGAVNWILGSATHAASADSETASTVDWGPSDDSASDDTPPSDTSETEAPPSDEPPSDTPSDDPPGTEEGSAEPPAEQQSPPAPQRDDDDDDDDGGFFSDVFTWDNVLIAAGVALGAVIVYNIVDGWGAGASDATDAGGITSTESKESVEKHSDEYWCKASSSCTSTEPAKTFALLPDDEDDFSKVLEDLF